MESSHEWNVVFGFLGNQVLFCQLLILSIHLAKHWLFMKNVCFNEFTHGRMDSDYLANMKMSKTLSLVHLFPSVKVMFTSGTWKVDHSNQRRGIPPVIVTACSAVFVWPNEKHDFKIKVDSFSLPWGSPMWNQTVAKQPMASLIVKWAKTRKKWLSVM